VLILQQSLAHGTRAHHFECSVRLGREAGRREVLQLLRRYECVTSAIMPVEIRSTLRRRLADGSLDDTQLSTILERFATDREFWALVNVTGDVLSGAESLVAAHPLRALDAIHVASAQLFAARIGEPKLLFISADARQTAAAAAMGMTARAIGS
jgi:uncharacterized protein